MNFEFRRISSETRAVPLLAACVLLAQCTAGHHLHREIPLTAAIRRRPTATATIMATATAWKSSSPALSVITGSIQRKRRRLSTVATGLAMMRADTMRRPLRRTRTALPRTVMTRDSRMRRMACGLIPRATGASIPPAPRRRSARAMPEVIKMHDGNEAIDPRQASQGRTVDRLRPGEHRLDDSFSVAPMALQRGTSGLDHRRAPG